MKKIKDIIVSEKEPMDSNAAWLLPSQDGTLKFKVYSSNGWTDVVSGTKDDKGVSNVLAKYLVSMDLAEYLGDKNLTKTTPVPLLLDGTVGTVGTVYSNVARPVFGTTDFIEISDYPLIKLYNVECASNLTEVALACFYDEDQNFISSVKYPRKDEYLGNIVIEVPDKAVFIRVGVSGKGSSENIIYIFVPYELIDIEHIMTYKDNKVMKPYYGNKILFIGDEYAAYSTGVGDHIGLATGCYTYSRMSVGGKLKDAANDNYSTSIHGGITTGHFDSSLLAPYTIVVIMGGINDYLKGNTTLGSLETMEEDGKLGKDCKTIYGAVWYLINKILTMKPSIKIFFCTQPSILPPTANGHNEENSDGLNMEKIANAIVDAAGHFGIPVFDFYHCSGWNEWSVKFDPKALPGRRGIADNIYTDNGVLPKYGERNGSGLLGTALGMFINSH